jgi:hypothetical protein
MKIRVLLFSFILSLVAQHVIAGDTASDARRVSKFTVLKIQGNFKVVLIPGDNYDLKVNGDKSAITAVHSSNVGTSLNITMDQGTTGDITLYVTFKDILQISINGNIKVCDTRVIKSDDLSLTIDGNTEGTLDLKVKMLTFTSNTDKNLTLKGSAEKCNTKVEGEGAIDMSAFKVDDLTVDYASDTDIKVYARPDLHVKMGGAGNLTYYGGPKVKVFKVNGTGNPIEGK